jgi:hypothetical protein
MLSMFAGLPSAADASVEQITPHTMATTVIRLDPR